MHDPNDTRQVREAERQEKQAQERVADDQRGHRADQEHEHADH